MYHYIIAMSFLQEYCEKFFTFYCVFIANKPKTGDVSRETSPAMSLSGNPYGNIYAFDVAQHINRHLFPFFSHTIDGFL